MSDAFRCDFCEEFYEGDPVEKLYIKRHIDRQGTDVIKVADLCEDHAREIIPQKYEEGDE